MWGPKLWVEKWVESMGVGSKIVIHISAHPYCTEVWMTILESGWNLWVWLVGVVSRRWVWLVGGI